MRTLLLTLTAMALSASGLAAQSMSGWLTDATTGENLVQAEIVAIADGQEVARTVSDSTGAFQLGLPRNGLYWFRASKPGYEPMEMGVGVRQGARISMMLRFRLTQAIVAMPTAGR
jgi:hypothetical protein